MSTLTLGLSSDWGKELLFAHSESKAVGAHGKSIDIIRENAPRIVGGLKMAGDITAALTFDPFLIGYAAFSLVGRVILMTYGTKSNQKKVADEEAQQAAGGTTSIQPSTLGKVTHPRQYPVEASAAFSTVGELFETGYGVSQFVAGKTGFTATIMGALSVFSYANILFGKEKKTADAPAEQTKESLNFASSESKPVGIIGRFRAAMKNNPVLVSSVLQVTCSVGMLIGGVLESYGVMYIAYNTLGLLGNLVQAFFVRKNEFNVEGTAHTADASKTAGSFQERVDQSRSTDKGLQHS